MSTPELATPEIYTNETTVNAEVEINDHQYLDLPRIAIHAAMNRKGGSGPFEVDPPEKIEADVRIKGYAVQRGSIAIHGANLDTKEITIKGSLVAPGEHDSFSATIKFGQPIKKHGRTQRAAATLFAK